MEKIVDLVAPRSCLGLLVKAAILVTCFTVVDYMISNLTYTFTSQSPFAAIMITFLIGAPFGLFVMAVMNVQRRLKDRLQYLSETDLLTGLPNRSSFFTQASEKISLGEASAVLMIDVDNFKQINDTYGHYAGDVALKLIGRHLRKQLRDGDVAGRIGGEEFAVLLDAGEIATIDHITQSICETIVIESGTASEADFNTFSITFSIGGVMALPGQKLVDLMKFADQALYRAKSEGRNRIVFHRLDARASEVRQAS